MTSYNYGSLLLWKKASDLLERVYEVVADSAFDDDYRLAEQTKQAAVSLPAQIAQGHSIDLHSAQVEPYYVAVTICAQLLTQLQVARSRDYIDPITYEKLHEGYSLLIDLLGKHIATISADDMHE